MHVLKEIVYLPVELEKSVDEDDNPRTAEESFLQELKLQFDKEDRDKKKSRHQGKDYDNRGKRCIYPPNCYRDFSHKQDNREGHLLWYFYINPWSWYNVSSIGHMALHNIIFIAGLYISYGS